MQRFSRKESNFNATTADRRTGQPRRLHSKPSKPSNRKSRRKTVKVKKKVPESPSPTQSSLFIESVLLPSNDNKIANKNANAKKKTKINFFKRFTMNFSNFNVNTNNSAFQSQEESVRMSRDWAADPAQSIKYKNLNERELANKINNSANGKQKNGFKLAQIYAPQDRPKELDPMGDQKGYYDLVRKRHLQEEKERNSGCNPIRQWLKRFV